MTDVEHEDGSGGLSDDVVLVAGGGQPQPRGNPSRDLSSAATHHHLALLDAAAQTYVAGQRPANTLIAYAADWRLWEDFTLAAGIPLLSGSSGALVGFVRWLETTRAAAPSTIERRLTGAVVGLRQLRVALEPGAERAARHALNGYKRRLAEAGITRGRGKAHPITLTDLHAVSVSCPDTLAGRRDRAMVLLGFGIAARCSDLANLLVTDITSDSQGLVVTVRHGKSIGESQIPYGKHPQTCAVRAWQAWTDTITIEGSSGPAFRRVTRHDTLVATGLSPQAVDQALTRAGARAGLPYTLTAHSLRAGFATEARRADVPDHIIADQGRWTRGSTALHHYFRRLDAWTDNPLSQLDI